MKKILSLILAGLMTVSCAAFVAADDAAVEATTDPVQDYAIEFLANCGVFKGGEGLTNEDLIQRYQMALFVSRISTGWVDDATWEDGTANDATFKDIDTEPANKYLGALSYANQNGIIEGYTANTFAPYASITYRDALTMVVRTLGYKGLSYPWGNIEKAVELGLTEGVDAAYTDELTRGEVAVIIYNAMFAKNSKGETLAKSIFGYDYGFQNIVIVSTDEYGYAANGDRAAAGYVGFKTIDENGVLGSKVYYVKASEFGFEGHEEELAVGEVFVALFEIDGDYTNMIDVASMKTATVMNNGITDNEGKAYETMPIAAALADYTLVKDYNNGILNYTYDDLRVYAYGDVKVYDADGHATWIGIDDKCNIVKWTVCSESTHGADNADCKCAWEIAWFYNAELDRYYNYVVKDTTLATVKTDAESAIDVAGIAIDWMDDKQFNEWYVENIRELVATYSELTLQETPATAITNGKAPYAKLNLFNIDEDAQAEIATYKSYSIGIISKNTTDYKCYKTNNNVDHSAGVVMPAYVITDLDGNNKDYVFVEEGHTAHDVDLTKGFGWLNVDESVTTFDEAKGGVVLYNWNKTTGEIEIVKHITEGTNDDADSKIITGVLQAYSTKNKTVTIDGTVYPIDYDNLAGDMYAMANTETAARKVVGATLDAQYMQYITAVVCDGYVVDTDLRGSDTDAIVVLGYAGITSDGYIAVYGYKTDSLKLEVIKVNSYNGWKKGDYRYYPANAEEDDAFDFGSLYTIKSYDTESNSYGVYTENVETVLEKAVPVRISFENGYRVVQPMVLKKNGNKYSFEKKDVAPTVAAMTSADKYVIVTNNDIYVHDGVVSTKDNYFVSGLMVASKLDAASVVVYTLDNLPDLTFNAGVAGFNKNAYDIGYVVYEKNNGVVLDAAYDEAISGTYLLGSTMSEVTVFNLLTGTRDVVIASSNIDLNPGCLYKTYGNQILQEVNNAANAFDGSSMSDAHDFINAIRGSYASTDLNYADYIVTQKVVDLTKDTLTKTDLAIDLGLITVASGDAEDASATQIAIAKKLIHDDFAKKIYTYTNDFEWDWYGDDTALELTALSALSDKTTYTADLVYEVATGKVVIYIYDSETTIKADPTVKEITNDVTKLAQEGLFGHTEYQEPNKTTKTDIGLYGKYTVEATYNNDECVGDPTDLKLTKVTTFFATRKLADDSKSYVVTELASGACELHNMLADDDQGFGVDYTDDSNYKVYVLVNGNGRYLNADEYTITGLTCCDLGYKAEIVLKNGIALNLTGDNTVDITVRDTNNNAITTNAKLTAKYVQSPIENVDTFETITVTTVDAVSEGDINLNLNIYDNVPEKVVVIG